MTTSPIRPVRVGLALAAGALALAGCQSGATSSPAASSSTVATAGATTSASATPGTGVSCSYPSDGSTPARPVDPPSTSGVPNTGTSTATINLDGEPVVLTLDRAKAPCTVNSFTSLARQRWFDDTRCHRLTDQGLFVLQCGDPSATGRGGPGYSFADELSGSETYPKGTVAMANAGANTNGSQFFIVWQDTALDAKYTVFGTVDANGMQTVEKIAAQGVAADGTAPNAPARISTVTLG